VKTRRSVYDWLSRGFIVLTMALAFLLSANTVSLATDPGGSQVQPVRRRVPPLVQPVEPVSRVPAVSSPRPHPVPVPAPTQSGMSVSSRSEVSVLGLPVLVAVCLVVLWLRGGLLAERPLLGKQQPTVACQGCVL
jgi:hypothetical protein